MDTIGVDLHKRETQLCVGQADGTIIEQRMVTSRERFTAVLGHRPPARVRASGWRSIWRRWGMR